MAEQLNPKEIVSFREILLANSIQVDALAQLLIEKGIVTEQEYFTRLNRYRLSIRARQTRKDKHNECSGHYTSDKRRNPGSSEQAGEF
ncbi:MAG: hypothetical protein HQ589_08790 [Syntrophaceae bacterium]|nr:hypothetical protein [Syntrophaceae bacterium]